MIKYLNRLLIVLGCLTVAFILYVNQAQAYNYAGYRWGGYWPVVTVDYNQVYLTSWRNVITGAENNWNNTGARFTFQNGTSNNTISVTYQNNNTLATTTIYRQWGFWGNVVRCTVRINSFYSFNPPYTWAFDLATVMRHEFGHWLVLNHTNPPSLMQPSFAMGEVRFVGTDDRNGIRAIYGIR